MYEKDNPERILNDIYDTIIGNIDFGMVSPLYDEEYSYALSWLLSTYDDDLNVINAEIISVMLDDIKCLHSPGGGKPRRSATDSFVLMRYAYAIEGVII
jgi:hypothetical protein